MATVYDVAREAKVSISTVSRVFNHSDIVSESTRLRVKRVAEELNYSPHLGARSLVNSRTDTIGIILPEMYGEFFSEFVKGIDSAARKRELHLLLSSSHDNAEEMAAALSAMRGRVDGIIVMSPLISADSLKKYAPKDMPIVIVNGGPPNAYYPTVSLDNYTGAFRMMEHLIEEGHQRIVLISGPANNQDAEQRKLGYVGAMEKKIPGYELDIIEGDFSETSGYRSGLEILSRATWPEAIFASNDAMAIGCLSALNDHGVTVPHDIALAGFDDIPLARYVRPSLSTVGVPIAELGIKSLEVLVDKILQKKSSDSANEYIYVPALIIRDSSKKSVVSVNSKISAEK